MLSGLKTACAAVGKWGLTVFSTALILTVAGADQAAWAKGPLPMAQVSLAELPKEAQATERAIRAGGPHPYRKDGAVFGNRERILPAQPRGYYREYTVKTPKSRDRGARRIVCGGQEVQRPDACFYTDDHYASFRLITP
jgi:ribonuclease T1